MSWLYSRALVEEYSGASCLDGAPSAPSSATPTPQAYLQQGRTTEHWRRFPSGMTCAALTEGHGEELLTSYLAGFHARTSAPPARERGSKESDPASGWRWRGSFARFDPGSSSWRTRQCSLLGGSESFSETWPRWGSMRNGECSERTMPGHLTSVTGSGSSRLTGNAWPTPTSADASMGSIITKDRFSALVETGKPATRKDGGEYGVGLLEMVLARQMFATPTATANQLAPSMQKHPGCRAMWPTPTAHNAKECNAPAEQTRNTPTLAAQAGGKLNPPWVEWLMGWPIGWTDCEPLETGRCQQWLRSHGLSCCDD